MIGTPHPNCSGDKIEKNEMGVAYSTYDGEERLTQGFGGETRVKESTSETLAQMGDNIKMDLQEVECGVMDWIDLAQDTERW